MIKSNTAAVAAIGFSGLLFLASAVLAPASAKSWTEKVRFELTYLGTDLSKREQEYSTQMNVTIHVIVAKHYDDMEVYARKALKAADKQWGAEHVNTEMAVAMAHLARANAIDFFGGASRAEAKELIGRARIFPALYPEFPGSYYIGVLADISEARLVMTTGTEAEAAVYYDKALAAMKQSPGMSNIWRVQGERDFLMVP